MTSDSASGLPLPLGHGGLGPSREEPGVDGLASQFATGGRFPILRSAGIFLGVPDDAPRRSSDEVVCRPDGHLAPFFHSRTTRRGRCRSPTERPGRVSRPPRGAAYRHVPRDQFPEVLRRIAENTSAVWGWAPPVTPVRACLVPAEGAPPKRKTYDYGKEPVVVHTPTSLACEFKADTCESCSSSR